MSVKAVLSETLPLGFILDGRQAAREDRAGVRRDVATFVQEYGVRPMLAAIVVGESPASRLYVEKKQGACRQVGIISQAYNFAPDVSEDELVHFIYKLNGDAKVHGILLQLSLPDRALESPALAEILPDKDVDGLSPTSQARLLAGEPGLRPCTPLAVMKLIDRTELDLTGKRAVIVGGSALVGKPLALMLLQRNATVTICHEFTQDLGAEVSRAEIVISAVGMPGLIRGEWIRTGAVVIDVGISRTAFGIKGDVEFEAARTRASYITPVPGGVGPMTIAMLLRNTLRAAEQISMKKG